jgi:hypothetical protein
MERGTLSFDLPEDVEAFKVAQNGWKYKAVIDDMFNWVRHLDKYTDRESVKPDEIRQKLVELMEDNDLT